MKRTIGIYGAVSIVLLGWLSLTCSRKEQLPTIPNIPSDTKPGETTYVQVEPPWVQANGLAFNQPGDVMVGFDLFIYVADTQNDRVIKLDQQGNFIEQYSVPHPVTITQDRQLNLIAVGAGWQYCIYVDTTIVIDTTKVPPETTYVIVTESTAVSGFATIYKRSYQTGGRFDSVYTPPAIKRKIVQDTTKRFCEPSIYPGIAADPLPDKSYFVADLLRGDVYKFKQLNYPEIVNFGTYVTPPTGVATRATGSSYLLGVCAPGQAQVFRPIDDFFEPLDTCDYLKRTHLSCNGNFVDARDLTFDALGNVYVLDRAASQILKYDNWYKFILRFGAPGSGNKQFRNPSGIAWYDGVLYVADTGNNRIVRFILSTDIEH